MGLVCRKTGSSGTLPEMPKAPGETLAAFLATKPEALRLPFLAWEEQQAKQRRDSQMLWEIKAYRNRHMAKKRAPGTKPPEPATQNRVNTFGKGAPGKALAPGQTAGSFKLPTSQLAARFFNSGKRAAESAQEFVRAAGGSRLKSRSRRAKILFN